MTTCPYCLGQKRAMMIVEPGCRVVTRDCQDCDGTGLVNDDVIARRALADRCRAIRKGRNATLKDVADVVGISVVETSKMELGRMEPSQEYLAWCGVEGD